MSYRLHLLSLAHTETTSQHLACAYTTKVMRFAEMMTGAGYEVILYSGEHNEAPCTEHVQVISASEQLEFLGPHDSTKVYDPDWFGPAWRLANDRTIVELGKRIHPRDFICVSAGRAHQRVCEAFPYNMAVETGIGYEGTFAKYRVFESYAWMHYLAGVQRHDDISYYDCVIPNYYNPDDFPFGTHDGDYLLWIGRFTPRKGPHIALQIAQSAGKKLVMAGQGYDGSLPADHVGVVDAEQRANLMGGALAVIVPTTYLGPFEGVAVEAMLCGTPIITTDWGAFTEYNIEGKTGFRFRTLGEGVAAVAKSSWIDHRWIRSYAQRNFSMDRVVRMYSAYFDQLYDLWDEGWSKLRAVPGRYNRLLI